MPTTVRYEDRTLKFAADVMWTATMAGIAAVAFKLAGIIDLNVVISLVLTLFCAFVALFYRSAVSVEAEIGREGVSTKQGLGLGWHVDWPAVTDLVVVPLRRPRLAVVSPELSRRRGLSEWPLRSARLPRRARSMPATPEIMEAVATHSGRQIDVRPKP